MREPPVILIAEDEEDYILLLRKAFNEANITNPVHVVQDGVEAMAYLKGEGKYANRAEYPLPSLMLIDLKLPRYNGFEIISWVRGQPGLAALRLLVLTSSEDVRDINKAYQMGANSFLVKPYDFQDLVGLSDLIQRYWLETSRTPESFRAPRNPENGKSKSK